MKSLKDFNYLLSLDRRYTKTESEIFRILSRFFQSIISVTIRAFVSILKADHRPSEGVCFSFSHNN